MKKKLLISMLVASMVFSIGCGNNGDSKKDDGGQTADQTQTEEQEEEPADEDADGDAAEGGIWPDFDISDCDTFTQIVDRKLETGMGYANVKIGEEDTLMVCSGTFDDLEGHMAAIDSIIYIYDDGVPTEINRIVAGGTAYPLAVKDGLLYSCGNHEVNIYTIEDGEFVHVSTAWVDYDENGNETYFYQEREDDTQTMEDDTVFNQLFDEYFDAEVIDYAVVSK